MKVSVLIFALFSISLLHAQEISLNNPMFLWYNRPALIESKFNKGVTYLGYVDSDKKVNLSIFKNNILDTTICLHEYDRPTSDDHGCPAIIELNESRIAAFFSWHTSELYQTTYDIRSGEKKTIMIDNLATYNQVFQFKNGRIVLLYNKNVNDSVAKAVKRRISLRYSDDDAQTWSDEIIVLEPKDNEFPYFIANVANNKIIIAYAIYHIEDRQHRNIYTLTSDANLLSWYDNMEEKRREEKRREERIPVYFSPDSLDLNIFDINIRKKPEILFTMFEPFYSKNRFQDAKLYLYKGGKVRYISENSTVVYSTGGCFYKNKIYNVSKNSIEVFSKNDMKKRNILDFKDENMPDCQLREIRVVGKNVYAIVSDSTYIKEVTKWNTKIFILKNKNEDK